MIPKQLVFWAIELIGFCHHPKKLEEPTANLNIPTNK